MKGIAAAFLFTFPTSKTSILSTRTSLINYYSSSSFVAICVYAPPHDYALNLAGQIGEDANIVCASFREVFNMAQFGATNHTHTHTQSTPTSHSCCCCCCMLPMKKRNMQSFHTSSQASQPAKLNHLARTRFVEEDNERLKRYLHVSTSAAETNANLFGSFGFGPTQTSSGSAAARLLTSPNLSHCFLLMVPFAEAGFPLPFLWPMPLP